VTQAKLTSLNDFYDVSVPLGLSLNLGQRCGCSKSLRYPPQNSATFATFAAFATVFLPHQKIYGSTRDQLRRRVKLLKIALGSTPLEK
jgi:hypothetical protein